MRNWFLLSMLLGLCGTAYAVTIHVTIPDTGELVPINLDESASAGLTGDDTFQQQIDLLRPGENYYLMLIQSAGNFRAYDSATAHALLIRHNMFNDPFTHSAIVSLYPYRYDAHGAFVIDRGVARTFLRELVDAQPPVGRNFELIGTQWLDTHEHNVNFFTWLTQCQAWQSSHVEHPAEPAPYSVRYGYCDEHADYYGQIHDMLWLNNRQLDALKNSYRAAFTWVDRPDVTPARLPAAHPAPLPAAPLAELVAYQLPLPVPAGETPRYLDLSDVETFTQSSFQELIDDVDHERGGQPLDIIEVNTGTHDHPYYRYYDLGLFDRYIHTHEAIDPITRANLRGDDAILYAISHNADGSYTVERIISELLQIHNYYMRWREQGRVTSRVNAQRVPHVPAMPIHPVLPPVVPPVPPVVTPIPEPMAPVLVPPVVPLAELVAYQLPLPVPAGETPRCLDLSNVEAFTQLSFQELVDDVDHVRGGQPLNIVEVNIGTHDDPYYRYYDLDLFDRYILAHGTIDPITRANLRGADAILYVISHNVDGSYTVERIIGRPQIHNYIMTWHEQGRVTSRVNAQRVPHVPAMPIHPVSPPVVPPVPPVVTPATVPTVVPPTLPVVAPISAPMAPVLVPSIVSAPVVVPPSPVSPSVIPPVVTPAVPTVVPPTLPVVAPIPTPMAPALVPPVVPVPDSGLVTPGIGSIPVPTPVSSVTVPTVTPALATRVISARVQLQNRMIALNRQITATNQQIQLLNKQIVATQQRIKNVLKKRNKPQHAALIGQLACQQKNLRRVQKTLAQLTKQARPLQAQLKSLDLSDKIARQKHLTTLAMKRVVAANKALVTVMAAKTKLDRQLKGKRVLPAQKKAQQRMTAQLKQTKKNLTNAQKQLQNAQARQRKLEQEKRSIKLIPKLRV